MSQVVGEGVLHVGVDDRDVGPGIEKAGRDSGKRFTSSFKRGIGGLAAAAAGAFAAAGAGAFLKGAIDKASDLNETVNKTKVVFGGASDEVLAFAKQGAAAFGQTQQQVLDAAGTFGTFGKAAGLQGKDLAGFSTQLSGLSSDLASFFNVDPGDAAAAIGAGLRGEAEPLRQFGILMDDASLRQQALRLGLIKTTKDALTPQAKVLAAHALILAQTKDAQGDFARTSGGLANQQRILSATFSDLQTKIGVVFLPAALAVTKALVGLLNRAVELQPVLSRVGGAIRDFAGPILTQLGTILGPLLHDAGQAVQLFFALVRGDAGITDSNGPFVKLAFQAAVFVKRVLPQIVEFVRTQVIPTLQSIAGSILPLVQQVLPLVVGFIRTQVVPAFLSIASQVVPVLQTASTTFRTVLLPAIISLAQYVVANLLPILGQIAQIIVTEVIPTVLQIAKFLYGTLYPAIVAIVTQVARQLLPVFDTLVQVFKTDVLPTVQALIEQIRTQLLPALEPLIQKILVVVGFLLKLAAAILAKVLPPVLKLAGFILRNLIPVIVAFIVIAVRVIDKILGIGIAFAKIVGAIGSFITHIVSAGKNGIGEFLGFIIRLPIEIGKLEIKLLKAGAGLIGAFLRGLSRAGGFAKNFAGSVWGVLKGFLNDAIDQINSALEIRVSVGFGKHIDINPPDIPHLARGTSNFGGGFALVGEQGPELVGLPRGSQVVPAGATAAALGGSHVHIYGDVRPHNYRDFQRETLNLARQSALGGPRPMRAVAGGVR